MKLGSDCIGVAVTPILYNGKGEYLLEHRSERCRDEQNRWANIGGGAVEQGETLEEALLREVKEEVGTKPFNIEKLGFREVFREQDGRQTHWIVFDFLAEVDPDGVKIMEPEMVQEIRWCKLEDFPEPQHSQFPKFLAKYRDRL